MTFCTFDLEDGKPPVSIVVAAADTERFMTFLQECQDAIKEAAELWQEVADTLASLMAEKERRKNG